VVVPEKLLDNENLPGVTHFSNSSGEGAMYLLDFIFFHWTVDTSFLSLIHSNHTCLREWLQLLKLLDLRGIKIEI
jgi:hypothetical protein